MRLQRRKLLLWVTLVAASAMPAFSQTASRRASRSCRTKRRVHPGFLGHMASRISSLARAPASGPGPVTNRSRRQDDGTSDYGQLVGDYTNPILQPWAAEVVKKKGEISLAGEDFPSPANQCWPEPPPFLFKHMAMQMLQQPDKIVMIFNEDHEVRWVRMNQPHPAQCDAVLAWGCRRPLRRRHAGHRYGRDQSGSEICHDRPVRYAVYGQTACGGTLSAAGFRRRERRFGTGRKGELAPRWTRKPQLQRQKF